MKFKTLKSAQDEAWFLEGIDGSSAIRIFSGLRIGLDDEGAASLAATDEQLEFQIIEDGIELSVINDTHLLYELTAEPVRSTTITSGSETFIELGDNLLKIFTASGDANEEELSAASAASITALSRNLQVAENTAAGSEEEDTTTRDVSIASLLRPDRAATKSATVTDLTTVARANKQPPEDVLLTDRFADIAVKLNAERQSADEQIIDRQTIANQAEDSTTPSKTKSIALSWFVQNPPHVTLSLILLCVVISIFIAVQIIVSVADPQNKTPDNLSADSLQADVARLIETNAQFDSQRTLSTARAIIAFQYNNPDDRKLTPILREWVEHLAQVAQDPDTTDDPLVAGRLMQLALLTNVDGQNLKRKIEAINPPPEPTLPLFEKTIVSEEDRSPIPGTQTPSANARDLQVHGDKDLEVENKDTSPEPSTIKTNTQTFVSPPPQQTSAAQLITKPTEQPSDVQVVELSTPAVVRLTGNRESRKPPPVQDSIALEQKAIKRDLPDLASVAAAKKKRKNRPLSFRPRKNPFPILR